MAEQIIITKEKPQNHSFVDNFNETIEVCGSRLCWDCASTGNSNFMSSEEYCYCQKCRGTGRETYYERRPNPNYNKEQNLINELNDYNQKSIKTIIGIKKLTIDTYEKSGNTKLLEKAKSELKQFEEEQKSIGILNAFSECLRDDKFIKKQKPEYFEDVKNEILKIKNINNNSSSQLISHLVSVNNNLIKSIESSLMKKAIQTPFSPNTFTTSPPKTFDHIPNLNKPQEPIITIKPVKWDKWCQFESDNGGFIDIMGRQSQQMRQVLGEQEKIRWGRRFIEEYRKYAEHCLQQNVEPDPIPNVDVLNRRLEYVTLSNGKKIYNKNYNDPGCIIG